MRILKMIESQRAMWDIRGRLEESAKMAGRCEVGGIGYGPCLLISRECGCGGADIARMAGDRLGWQVYDREIVDQIADLAHARQQLVASVDECIRSAWETTWRQVLFPDDVGTEAYLRYLREVVLTLGHHGHVVLLGRGAHYMLPRCCSLNVRLIAPVDVRIHRVAEIRHLPLLEAQAYVRELDGARDAFVRKYFRADPASPLNYDLVINTNEISECAAVEVIQSALQSKLGVVAPQKATGTFTAQTEFASAQG